MFEHPRRTILRTAGLSATALALLLWPSPPFSGDPAAADQAAVATPASDLWLAPAAEVPAAKQTLAQAVEALAEDEADRALPVFAKATSDPNQHV